MLSMKNIVSYIILLNVFTQIQSLVELSVVEDYYITTAETAIRDTVSKILTAFKIEEAAHKPRLKQFSTIHDFFVSITLTDCNNLKEIAKLTRVNNIDNNTEHFIAQINEVLNEDDKSYEANDTNNVYVTKYIGKFIRKLKYLKEMYVSNRNTVINANLLRYIDGEKPLISVTEVNNITKIDDSNESSQGDKEYWRPNARRIYQGIQTRIKKFPFIASVHFFKKFQCAGSIIKNDLVITSASCLQLAWNNRFFRENPAFLSVQVGSDIYEGGGDNIAVIEIYFYPKYDPKTLRNNLALMRLTRKIIFKEKQRRVKKIDFDRSPIPLPINPPQITVIGWGARDTSNAISHIFRNKLSYAHLDYYPLKDCQEHYSEDFVTEKNFCAGFFSKGSGACNRDAGGPGVIEDTLVGVISFGSPICGAPDAPTVFTKLGYYTDWIESIMDQVVPSNYQKITSRTPNTFFLTDIATISTMRIDPVSGKSPSTEGPRLDLEYLRTAQDQGFKDFLATMFSHDDIAEYFEKPSVNNNEAISESEDSDNNQKNTANNLHERFRSKGAKSKLKDKDVRTVDSSVEINVDKDQDTKTLTESERKVADLDNANNKNKHLEEDIMTLIDNLDIDAILKPELAENNYRAKNSIDTKKKTTKKEEEVIKVVSRTSKENYQNTNSQQQSVLNFLFLSKEDLGKKDEKIEGLSKQPRTEQRHSFDELTFRDKPNNTKKHEDLSESALYELISLAIDEEAKLLRKEKRYSL